MRVHFALLNVQGLVTKFTNKLHSQELKDIFCCSDFVFLTETWSDSLVDLSVPGFTLIQLSRVEKKQNTKRNSGGIAIYIRESFKKYCTLLEKDSDDIIWIKIGGQLLNLTHDLYVCLCYIVPSASSREALIEMDVLDRITNYIIKIANDTNDNYNILICGDFNSRIGNENDYVIFDNDANIDILPIDYVPDDITPRFSQDNITNANGRKLLDFCKLNGLRVGNGRLGSDKGVGKHTYVGSTGSSVIDYIIANPSLLDVISSFHVADPNILSDHCCIDFSILCKDISEMNLRREKETFTKVNKKYMWNEARAGEYIFNLEREENGLKHLSSVLTIVSTPQQIDENIQNFTSLMEEACDPLFSKNFFSSQDIENFQCRPTTTQPWFDEECRKLRNLFYSTLNNYRRDKSTTNQANFVKARSNFKKTLRRKRYNFAKEKTSKLIASKSKNAKEYWKLLKDASHLKSKCSIDVKMFSEYFQAINDPNNRFYQADEDILYFNERYMQGEFQVMFDELNLPISMEEIKLGVSQLRNGTSAGPDLFLNEFLKNGTQMLITYIHTLFNKIFEIGYFPEIWVEGHIIPIYKKGDKTEVSNYRGITLLSVVGKLFTRILNNRLNKWAEEYSIYVEAQAGFRKSMGTTDNIFILNNLITHCLNNNERLYCAFVDFTKAFDFVVRDILWFKLIKLGVRGKLLNIIKSIYTSVKSRVKYDNYLSEPFACNIGVRQGECLSPFLFAMYVNDLEAELAGKGISGVNIGIINLYTLLYADDIILFGKTPEDLQNAMNVLEEYCKRWKLTVNTDKTKIVVFRKGGRLPHNLNFTYGNSKIEIVNKFCYLGVVFSAGGSNFETQKTLSGQALKAIFTLNKYLFNFTSLKPSHVLDLFDKLITPILNFGSEVWGFSKSPSIETVHLQYCKKLLGVKQSTQNDFIYGELGRIDYQSRRYLAIIRYWFKVVGSEENKYIKQVYNMMLSDMMAQPLKINWASCIKDLLSRLGFLIVWETQGVGNVKAFLNIFKQRVGDVFRQNWHSRLENSTRARCYIAFADFQYQNYLDVLNITKYRENLSRLRLSSHRLEVEVGRWAKPNKIPYQNRKCKVCHVLEDEFHFLLECPLYTDLRKRYINKFFWARPNMLKFIELISISHGKTLKQLSVFIEKAFQLRKEIILL